jgi:hypothetical protein
LHTLRVKERGKEEEIRRKKELSKLRNFLFTLVVVLLIVPLLIAQAPTGKITGTVADEQGVPLPGVSVDADSPTLVGTALTTTDINGAFRLFGLPSGRYTLRFSLQGFNTVVRQDIIVRVEQTIRVEIEMTPGALEEEITVIGQSPLVDVKSTTKGMTLTREMFEMLPRGRNFDTLVTTVPGVNEEPYVGGLSVDGASGAENMYYIDGMDITNMDQGDRDQSAAFEFVEEVQIVASGYQAEFGGSMGGVVNVITRAGGNEFHGELIGYYSGSKLYGKERDTLRQNPLDTSIAEYVNYQDLYGKDEIDRWEVGFSLGGYIIKDRLWFFGTFLPVFRGTTRHVEWVPEGTAPASDHEQKQTWLNGQVKLTAQPLKDLRLAAAFVNNFYKYRGDLPARDGTENPDRDYGGTGFDYPNMSATLTADYTVGSNLFFSLRGGYFYRNQTNQIPPALGIPRYRFMKEAPGYANTNNLMFPEIPPELQHGNAWYNISAAELNQMNKNIRNRMAVNFDTTLYVNLAGEHAWKAGVQAVRIEEDIDNTAQNVYVFLGWDREFTYLGTGETVRGQYGYYAIRGGDSGPYGTFANPNSTRWALYLQDSWTPSFANNKLTLNFGIRAEKEDIPSFSDLPEYDYPPVQFDFFDKIAPRVGFIYDVFGDASTKIFGSYGWYYDVMKLDMAVGSYGGLKWTSDYYTLDDYDYTKIDKTNPGACGQFLITYDWREPSFDSTDPDLKPVLQTELTFGAERKLMENLSASVRVVYKHIVRAIEDVGVLTPGGESYYTANPGFGYTRPESQGGQFADIYPACPKAKRDYWGVNIGLDKRFSDNWLAGFSYTWSRLWGNFSGLASSDEWGRNDPMVERYWDLWWHMWDKNMNEIVGNLNTDRTHQFKFYGSYAFPFGMTVGTVVNAMSGIPVTRELHTGLEGYYPDGRLTDGRTPFLWLTNLYAEYNLSITDRYKIQLSLNVDNVFDISTGRRIHTLMNQTSTVLTDEERLAGWTYDNTTNTVTTINRTLTYIPDPRFGMERDFNPPISARVGIKFIF